MKRVLIVKLWALGDILMATPLLTALRKDDPERHITWVADVQHADILQNHPLIDELIPFDSGRWRRLLRKGRYGQWLAEARRLHREMRARQFDAAINCHPEKWWTRILCAAPVRIGLYPSPNLPLTRRLYTKALPKAVGLHNTDDYLRTLPPLGIHGPFERSMTLPVSPEDRAEASAFLQGCPDYRPGAPLIILHPGTSQPSKCWPPESFAAVAAGLKHCNLVVTGSPRESVLADAIRAAMPTDSNPLLIAAGRLSGIGAVAALVEQAAAVVTGDTALLHIASALGTPLVGIYGSTRPGDNAPLFGPQILLFDERVPCAPCYREHCPLSGDEFLRCQKAVTPAQVLFALETLLKESYERSSNP